MFRLVRLAGVLLVFLSCTSDERVGPAPIATQQAVIGTSLSGSPLPDVRVSEFHYDNVGTDAGEAIEVSGPAGTDLTGWSLVLYNGSGGAPYATLLLVGTLADQCGGRGTAFVAAVGLQNGPADGFALVNPSGGVEEFLSYEGSFTAVGGPADAQLSRDIGLDQEPVPPVGQSLQRTSDGAGWFGPAASTFGTCNVDPTIARVMVSPASATIGEGGTQQFTAAAFGPDNALIPVTFDWSSTSATVADVSGSGLATGRSAGDAGIIATAPTGVADTAELQVEGTPPPPPPPPQPGSVGIVEIHYDNDGTDTGEFIEVEGPAGAGLSGWTIVLYNGSNGQTYDTDPLPSVIPTTCDSRGVVVVTYPLNGIQNGPPDAIALVDQAGAVVEFLSYEGTVTAANGPAAGLTSTDIGVDQDPPPASGQTLQKDALGWYGPAPASLGACNARPGNRVSIVGRNAVSDPPLPVGFQDQLFAALLDANNDTVATTFTWLVETPALGNIDTDGVLTALAPGTVVVRATSADGPTATISLPIAVATASATASYEGNAEFGTPADGDASDDVIVTRDQYTASFNPARGTPNWVSYNLEVTHFGAEDRCDCFTFDPGLPASIATYTTAAYTGSGAFHGFGIDRGHLARSFDRTSATLDNATTFYFSNIIPQAADLNQGPWAALENQLGDSARFGGREVYVIAGVAGARFTLKDEGRIVMPASVWKVALILPRDSGLAGVDSYDDVTLIAVIMPNQAGVRNVNWETYRATVDQVEAASGYDLLALLPNGVEGILESGVGDVERLIDGFVNAGTLDAGNGNALTVTLHAAARQIADGNGMAGLNQARAFLQQVEALQRAGRLPPADGDALRAAVAVVVRSAS